MTLEWRHHFTDFHKIAKQSIGLNFQHIYQVSSKSVPYRYQDARQQTGYTDGEIKFGGSSTLNHGEKTNVNMGIREFKPVKTLYSWKFILKWNLILLILTNLNATKQIEMWNKQDWWHDFFYKGFNTFLNHIPILMISFVAITYWWHQVLISL